jgi:uncharacterized protein (DUF1330 family)
MPAYFIARIDVTDPAQFEKYTAAARPIVEQFGGKYIARSEDVVTLEGDPEGGRIVIIEFPSVADTEAFYHSDVYAEAILVREGAAVAQMVVVPGLD